MTELLERVIEQLQTFDADKQNAIASLILEELEDEEKWDAQFANSQDLLARLGAEAVAEHEAGLTQDLDADKREV